MYYCPYYQRESPQPSNSQLRVTNASPNMPAVDVYADGRLIAQNLKFKDISQYTSLPAGKYDIKVYPAGQKTNLLFNTDAVIAPDSAYNLAIIGMAPRITMYLIPEPVTKENFGRPCIRFVNLSPDSKEVDLVMPDGMKLFENVNYKGASVYACLPAGTYTFELRPYNMSDVIASVSDVELQPDTYYTLYAVGLSQGSPKLELILVPEPR